MGYLAITSQNPDAVIEKTSETIMIKNKKTFIFFEIELGLNDTPEIPTSEFGISIIVPGKISKITNAEKIVNDPTFIPWYYSQKSISAAGPGMRLRMNDNYTTVINSQVESNYNKHNKISQVDLVINYHKDDLKPVKSLHTFFCIKLSGHVKRQRGNLFAESRYFDKKLCPKGDFFDNTILKNNVLPVKKIYCWFVLPRGYLANDYTTFGIFAPRDSRIVEREYKVLLKGRSVMARLTASITDAIYGRPQIINWAFNEEVITFNQNYTNIGKWDEIRLFVSSSSFPFRSIFLSIASYASIMGLFIAILVVLLDISSK